MNDTTKVLAISWGNKEKLIRQVMTNNR